MKDILSEELHRLQVGVELIDNSEWFPQQMLWKLKY